MTLSKLEDARLERYILRYGAMESSMQCLSYAINAEQTCRDIGPFDPAFSYFCKEQRAYEEYAELLEKSGL